MAQGSQSEQVCITQDPKASTEMWSQQKPYDNNRAGIAVYNLRTYNPLLSAFSRVVSDVMTYLGQNARTEKSHHRLD